MIILNKFPRISTNFKKDKGVATLVTVLSLGTLIFIISLSTTILAFWSSKNIGAEQSGLKAYYAAYSGIQDGLIKLERNKDFTGNFNLDVNGTNDVSVAVTFYDNQATIISTSTLSQINKKLQTVADINTTTGLIAPISTTELAFIPRVTTTTEPPTTTTTTEPPTTTTTIGGCATSTDPGISNVYYNTNYYFDGVSKTGTLQRACYNTGAKELGATGNFCGDTQGTSVAGDICNSVKAWVDGSLITGNRTDCSSGGFIQKLPDTGQTLCYSNSGTTSCGDANFPRQDADYSSTNSTHTCDPNYTTSTYTVIDNCTGLEWQRYGHGSSDGYTVPATSTDCYTNATYSANYCTYNWQDTLKYCSNLTLDSHNDWRLPNRKELNSILKLSGSAPFINTTAFLSTNSTGYLSATTYSSSADLIVSFSSGNIQGVAKTSINYVRCVRD